MIKTAAVVIEKWKLAIFTKHLREAGFTYDTAPALDNTTLTLKVKFDDLSKLQPIVQAAQTECHAQKRKKS